MSKRMYGTAKELPYIWYEIDAVEAWLDEQAQQGLRLTDIQRKLCVFQPSDEPPARYRVHVKPHNGYYTRREEYKETMRELGWEYVGQLHYRADIYRAARPDAVEINTDENALRESIKAANRGELCAGIVLILLIPWLLRNELRYMKFYDGFYDMLLDGTALLTAAAVFMAAFYLVLGIYAILRSIAQRRRYLLNRSFRPGPEIHKRKRVRIVLLTLAGISVMFLVVLGVGAAGNYYDVPLSNCPVVMLESLFPEEAAQKPYQRQNETHGTGGKHLLYSFATYRQSGPTIWLEGEYAGMGYPSFSYWVNVKDIRTESLAEKYFAEKEAAHDWQEVQIKGWDQAMYRRYTTNLRQEFHSNNLPDTPEMSQQELVLRLGNRVVTVGYTGEADMIPRLNTLYARRTAAGTTV